MGNNLNILYRDTQNNSKHSGFRLSAIIAFSFSFRYNNRIWKLTLFAKKINNEIMEKTS